jgi:hypothetical protein
MLTVSPPVSPSVVAAILMIQKIKVISGTLLGVLSPEEGDGILISRIWRGLSDVAGWRRQCQDAADRFSPHRHSPRNVPRRP